MCSIIASFSKSKILELVEINQHRGNFSYSISMYNPTTKRIINTYKDFGEFNKEALKKITGYVYYICHIQAPTSGLTVLTERIHPTEINNTYLWHNGIIKPQGMKYLKNTSKVSNNFDTYLLHTVLPDYKKLSEIEGLFACLYVNDGIKLFRTKHAKLYIDDDMNISSEYFEGSKCINYDTVYELNLNNRRISKIDNFETKRFNIIIQGESP